MNNIMDNIEQIRRKKGLKQSVVANELGIRQATYSGFISKKHDIGYNRILEICKVLNISIIDAITYPDTYIPIKDKEKVKTEQCTQCLEKETLLKQLSNYIDILEDKLNIKKQKERKMR